MYARREPWVPAPSRVTALRSLDICWIDFVRELSYLAIRIWGTWLQAIPGLYRQRLITKRLFRRTVLFAHWCQCDFWPSVPVNTLICTTAQVWFRIYLVPDRYFLLVAGTAFDSGTLPQCLLVLTHKHVVFLFTAIWGAKHWWSTWLRVRRLSSA